MNDYLVLLYYHYTFIEDLEAFREAHQAFCENNNLLGTLFSVMMALLLGVLFGLIIK